MDFGALITKINAVRSSHCLVGGCSSLCLQYLLQESFSSNKKDVLKSYTGYLSASEVS